MPGLPGKPYIPSVKCECKENKLELEAGHCLRCGHELPGGQVLEVIKRTGSRVSASTARIALAIAEKIKH